MEKRLSNPEKTRPNQNGLIKLTQINVTVDDKILEEFRGAIYKISGLQRGDLKKYLEIAIAEYILRHSKFTESKKFAKNYVQRLQQD